MTTVLRALATAAAAIPVAVLLRAQSRTQARTPMGSGCSLGWVRSATPVERWSWRRPAGV